MKYRFLRPSLSVIFLLALALFVPPAAVLDALRGLDSRFVLLVLALNLPLLGTKILRWGWLVRAEAPQVGWRSVGRSYLLGLGLGLITPSGAGEVGRAAFLPPDAPRLALTGKALLDKLIDVGVLAVLGALGLLLSGEGGAQVLGVVLLGLAGGGAALLYAPRPAFLPPRLLSIWEKVAGVPPRLFIRLALTAGLGFTCLYAQLYLLLVAFGEPPPVSAVFFFPLITLSTLAPTVSGLGTREWVAVLVLGRFSLDEGRVLSATFSHFVLTTILPALVGLAWVNLGRRGQGS